MFPGFYPPTTEEFKRLWNEATIVLDTNVLLYIYRAPPAAREEFFKLLDQIKVRLWIPHQVALEFQRNRLSVIASTRKVTETTLTFAKKIVADWKIKLAELEIEKRGLQVNIDEILSELATANGKLVEAMQTVHNEYEGTSHLRANGVDAPRLVVFKVINLKPCERGSP